MILRMKMKPKFKKSKRKNAKMDAGGIEPSASTMQMLRSTTELSTLSHFYFKLLSYVISSANNFHFNVIKAILLSHFAIY